MRPALRLLTYVLLTAALSWWAFAASWPDDCGYTDSCGLASANAGFAGGLVCVACLVVFGVGEAVAARIRRRRQSGDVLVDPVR